MKDLYKRLGISDHAPVQLLEKAIDAANDELLQEDTAYVLLDPKRKQVYDRNHRVLKSIAELRSQLELHDAPHWLDDTYEDYRPTNEGFTMKESAPAGVPERWYEREGLRFWLVFAAVLVFYILMYALVY